MGTNLFGHGENVTSVTFGGVPAIINYTDISNSSIQVVVQFSNTTETMVPVRIVADTFAVVESTGDIWTYLVTISEGQGKVAKFNGNIYSTLPLITFIPPSPDTHIDTSVIIGTTTGAVVAVLLSVVSIILLTYCVIRRRSTRKQFLLIDKEVGSKYWYRNCFIVKVT